MYNRSDSIYAVSSRKREYANSREVTLSEERKLKREE